MNIQPWAEDMRTALTAWQMAWENYEIEARQDKGDRYLKIALRRTEAVLADLDKLEDTCNSEK